jgi:hypothetical protein
MAFSTGGPFNLADAPDDTRERLCLANVVVTADAAATVTFSAGGTTFLTVQFGAKGTQSVPFPSERPRCTAVVNSSVLVGQSGTAGITVAADVYTAR